MIPREGKGPVQLIAQGLLGFFNLKDQGNPAVISDLLQGTLELKEWYLETQAIIPPAPSSLATLAANSTGFFAFVTGPLTIAQDEFRWVANYTVYAALALGTDRLQICAAYRHTTTGQFYQVGQPSPSIVGASRAVTAFGEKFWLPPGAELGFFVYEAATATTLTVLGSLRSVSLPI